MASEKLTQDQQEVNSILKEMGYSTFTSNEYKTNQLGIILLNKYQNIDSHMFGDVNFKLFIYKKLRSQKRKYSKIDLDTEIQRDVIKILFGLTHEPLIESIMDISYEHIFETDENGNDMSHLQIAINNPQFKLNQILKKPF